MGFGTLFFGYFLLLDLPYQTLTNIVAAMVMLLALYKLAYLNAPMKTAFYATVAFAVFSGGEAILDILDMLGFIVAENLPVWLGAILYLLRNALIGTVSVLILKGIEEVSLEVGLKRHAKKCAIWGKISICVFALNLALAPEMLMTDTDSTMYKIVAAFYIILTLFTLFVIIMNLSCIYGAYSGICMPEDKKEYTPRPSRFGFVNRFRAHEDEKRREYAEYKLEKKKKKFAKRNKK